MISILLLLILAWSVYIGYRRGLVLQLYYTLASILSAFLAGQFYRSLGEQFQLLLPYASPQEGQNTFFFPSDQLFQLDKVFYAGVAYLLVFSFFYSLSRFVGLFLHLLPTKKLGGRMFRILAAFLSFGVTLFVLQMVLTIFATIPMPAVQNTLQSSSLARIIIQSIPITTDIIKQLWVVTLIG